MHTKFSVEDSLTFLYAMATESRHTDREVKENQ